MVRFWKRFALILSAVLILGSLLNAGAGSALAFSGVEGTAGETVTEITEISESSEITGTEPEDEGRNTEKETEDEDMADDEQTREGTEKGETELVPLEDVFSVQLPALPEGIEVFDYILDPQQLLTATDNAAHDGIGFEESATFFFKNHKEGNIIRYSSESDRLTIVNQSTAAVRVKVDVSFTETEAVSLTPDPTFQDDESTSVYLAITDGEEITEMFSGETASLTMEIKAASSDAYKIVYDENEGTCSYELTEKAKKRGYDGFAEKSFYLVGASNPNGNWHEFTGELPELSVTWSVELDGDGVSGMLMITDKKIEDIIKDGLIENDLENTGQEAVETDRENEQESAGNEIPPVASPSNCVGG